ncbi:MAG: HAMP domain-containing protein [Treponema sp.]|nr:HAMP domain-containing protein [Treponema sp.]
MKALRIHQKQSIINIRGLILLYVLLCILTILFSGVFLTEILRDGKVPELLSLIVFFTVPAVLLLFLAFSITILIRDLIAHRTGSKFQARLLKYFFITVLLAATPVTIITIQSVHELIRFWRSVNIPAALRHAQNLALDNYAFMMERFEKIVMENDFDLLMAQSGRAVSEGTAEDGAAPLGDTAYPFGDAVYPFGDTVREIEAIQDFRVNPEGGWTERAFAGKPSRRLRNPPNTQRGFVPREMPRDIDTIRYIMYPERDMIRIISFSLGEGFDGSIETIENEQARFETIDALSSNIRLLLVYYYGIFLFPTLLMTVIITISFSEKVTQPIIELAEATRRVADGNFSIQILSRPGDELGLLISSFNAMVQDLEKSRMALVRSEKISIWQSMAQQLAHEIKNPLTPIKLSAERVLRRWRNEPERINEILEESMLAIIQEVESLSTLLNEFRTLSRPIDPSQEWTGLREIVENTIIPYRTSYPDVQFDIEHVGSDILVKIDKRYIAQILTNLIINGIDAMDNRGRIEIRTDLVKKRESRYCRLSVRDTGKGIGGQDVPHVFTPYFTTKESGTGLGLPIVERIVNDHGGTIWFNSTEGAGTTFFIDLPIDEPGAGDEKDQGNV